MLVQLKCDVVFVSAFRI